jgi:hypothetical protein
MKIQASIKHLQINKANNSMFIAVTIASIVTVFSLLSAKALLGQSSYQHKVLAERKKAVKQLKSDLQSAKDLKQQYDTFAKQDPNIIGGQGGEKTAAGPSDGSNARIVLDALPSQYDFPALISSIEKIGTNDHLNLQSISGTDEGRDSTPTSTSAAAAPATATATAVSEGPNTMSFSITSNTDYANSLVLLNDLERSIRPIDVVQLSIAGDVNALITSVQANTYYQPAISLQITQKEVK